MKALDRKLIRDLFHLRGQVIAVALVVACGIASFASMRSTYKSLLGTQQAYYAAYRFADIFAQIKRAPESLRARIIELPGVAAVQTRVVADVTLDLPGLEEPATGRLISIPENRASMLNDLHLVSGRYIESGRRDETIISSAFAVKNNFRPGDTLNAVINGRWTTLRIVGTALSPEYVYEIRAGDMFPDNRRFGVMWMNRQAIAAAFDMEGAFNNLAVGLSPGAKEEDLIDRIDTLLEPYGALGAYGRADQPSNHFLSGELDELRVSGTFIPAVFLGVTAFLIHLVLSRLVNTQREQIAALKAFGYDNRTIGFHYLKLALAAVSVGALLGGAAGWRFGYQFTALYAEFFRFPVLRYDFDPWVIGGSALISFGAASIGAMTAVRKAVALPPAEAMRPEPPARFQPGLIERMGFQRFFPLSLRMITRNLERNPAKSILTTLSIAMSVSLLVVGFYFYDAIDQIINVQFNAVQREDVSVIFNEPRPSRAQFELAAMPGVIRVEPYRAVAVRLRSGHRMRRVAIMGLDAESDLHRIVDQNYRSIKPPLDGLALSTKLGDILGVKPGDSVTVEIMEGARPVRQVPVVALIDELIGLGSYMEINSLNRMMREAGTISGAYMMIDSQQSSRLFSRLKHTPAISGVNIPANTLELFNATLARTMGMTTAIIVIFAGVIAAGMVYNSARIALSERGRELASLRVLGFSQAEVGVMLLGEQTILTAAAIPLGFGIGYLLCLLITRAIDTELMRLPLIFSGRTWAVSFLGTVGAAILSGFLVQRRIRRLNMVEALKTRE